MKVSDYIIEHLARQRGIREVFTIVGGANMHLVDSIARAKDIRYVCTQHEQAAAMAAIGYSRTRGGLGAALLTSGPGGTNALTGLCCAWTDSVPVLFLSGQVAIRDYTDGRTIRQLGVQQINIVDMVRPAAKYAALVERPDDVRYQLEKACALALEGRPGPVWLDIPQDVQMAEVDPGKLRPFPATELPPRPNGHAGRIPEIVERLKAARRPLVIVGQGARLAGARELLEKTLPALGFPTLTTWNGLDLLGEEHPLYIGRSGVFGQYGANFAVANADLILSLGSRLDTRQTGTRRASFAREAFKIAVDVSAPELAKGLIDIQCPIHADVKDFLEALLPFLFGFQGVEIGGWLARCREWKNRYPVTLPTYAGQKGSVNSYFFVDALSGLMASGDTLVTDMGTSLTCTHQAFKAKAGQIVFSNSGFAPMGFGLPAAIGAWFAAPDRRLVSVHGDGGIQMNIQEFQTVAHYKIPLKIFVLNNREYATIKQTQNAYFGGRIAAADLATGYSAPDFTAVARAYGLAAETISDHDELRSKLRNVLEAPGAVVCDVNMAPGQPLIPILQQRRRRDGTVVTDPIERLSPRLPEEEFQANMIVKPLDD